MPVRREAAVPPPGTAGSAWRGFEASGVSVETPPAGPSRARILLLHYTGPPVVGSVESALAGHARLLAGRGFEVHVLTGRGGAVGDGVHVHRLTALDSRHRRVLATSRVLESGRVPAEFVILTAEILAGLRRALEGIDVCIVHNGLTLDKNLALTAACMSWRGEERAPGWSLGVTIWRGRTLNTGPRSTAACSWDLLRTPLPHVTDVTVSRHRQRELGAALRLSPEEIRSFPTAWTRPRSCGSPPPAASWPPIFACGITSWSSCSPSESRDASRSSLRCALWRRSSAM